MNKKILVSLSVLVFLFLSGCANETKNKSKTYYFDKDGNMITEKNKDLENVSADKVQVFVFYATQRCVSCVALGELGKELLDEKFKDEFESGKIEFREINVDLPENKEVTEKFQARGSAFFLNTIIEGNDNIKEDTQVWRLVGNPDSFKNYLENKINKLLK